MNEKEQDGHCEIVINWKHSISQIRYPKVYCDKKCNFFVPNLHLSNSVFSCRLVIFDGLFDNNVQRL